MVRQKARSPRLGILVGNAVRPAIKRMVRDWARASHYMAERISGLRSRIPS